MISVLIVNWNTKEQLADCLASLSSAMLGLEYEVIVADNASADGSAEMVAERFPGVRLVANDGNLGYARANNEIASMAGGDQLLFLNPDTVLNATSILPLIERLVSSEDVALVAPQLLSIPPNPPPQVEGGDVQSSCRRFPTFWNIAANILRLSGAYRMTDFDHKTPREVDQPMATCWLVRREAWEEVGPFDEQFPIFFNDVDWCYRARRNGWRIWFEPAAKVHHHHGASTGQARRAMIWESHRSLLRYYRKHGRGGLRLFVAPLVLLSALVRAKGWHAGFRPDNHDR